MQLHLRDGVWLEAEQVNQTCTAGAGSLLLEFGLLSRLVRDPTYEAAAARVVRRLLHLRSNATGEYHSNCNTVCLMHLYFAAVPLLSARSICE